ncbi:MAG: hypothetical protein ACO3P9_04235, partial [Phycisphaerales bacterium]
MTPPPTSIDLVIRIGDAPPPASAIERWSTATWSHHADPFDGLVELGRRRFEVRAQQNWSADPTTRIAVLVTLREGAAELVAALASQARASAILIGLLPLMFASVLAGVDPESLTMLVTTPV